MSQKTTQGRLLFQRGQSVYPSPPPIDSPSVFDLNRRHFLNQVTNGLTGGALSRVLGLDRSVAAALQNALLPSVAKAKQVLQIFFPGAASHLDLWDHKPQLETLLRRFEWV